MKNIRLKESTVLDEFKNIVVLDKDGTPHEVPVLYANKEKLMAAMLGPDVVDPMYMAFKNDRLRLPIIGLNTTHIGHNHIFMEGKIYTLFREDMNQIVEQFYHTVELNENITIGTVEITDGQIYPAGQMGVHVLTGEFTVEFRESSLSNI